MPSPPLLEVRDVSRRFGYRNVFRNVTMSVSSGRVTSLLGPNGAGKTTLLRVLGGLLRASEGEVVRRGGVGMVAHQSMLYDALNARENLAFFARLTGGGNYHTIDALLQRVGLDSDQPVGTFSRGMVQRLAFARALLGDPEILLLDEPTSSLDDPACEMVLGVLDELRSRNRAIIIVTHQYDRVAPVTTEVGFLVGGTLREASTDVNVDSVNDRYKGLLRDA